MLKPFRSLVIHGVHASYINIQSATEGIIPFSSFLMINLEGTKILKKTLLRMSEQPEFPRGSRNCAHPTVGSRCRHTGGEPHVRGGSPVRSTGSLLSLDFGQTTLIM
jgi:hypothetical protein